MSGGALAVAPPDAVPVTVIVETPAGVAPGPLVVARVMVLVQGATPGVQDAGLNDADAPAGRPDTEVGENVTASASPVLVLVAVMTLVLFVVAPCRTETSFSLARVKVKGMRTETEALATAALHNGLPEHKTA